MIPNSCCPQLQSLPCQIQYMKALYVRTYGKSKLNNRSHHRSCHQEHCRVLNACAIQKYCLPQGSLLVSDKEKFALKAPPLKRACLSSIYLLLIHLFQSSQSSTIFCHSKPDGLNKKGAKSQVATRNHIEIVIRMYVTAPLVDLET